MAADDTVQVQIGVQADELRAGLDDAYDQLGKFGEQAQSAFDQMASASQEASKSTVEGLKGIQEQLSTTLEWAKKLAEAFLVFKGIEWGTELVKGGMEAAEQLQNMSEMTGINIRQMQELKFAATSVGIEFTTVAMGVRMLNRQLFTMQQGAANSTQARAYLGLGIDPTQIKGAEDAISKLSEAMKKYGDNARTVQEVTVAIGGRGAALIPLIRSWDELRQAAEASGAVLSGGTVTAAAEAAQGAWNQLAATWDAAKIALAAGLSPALNVVAKLLQEAVVEVIKLANNGELKAWAVDAGHEIILVVGVLGDAVAKLVEFGEMVAHFAEMSQNAFKEVAASVRIAGDVITANYGDIASQAFGKVAGGASAAQTGLDRFHAGLKEADDELTNFDKHVAELATQHAVGGPGTTGTTGVDIGPSNAQAAAAKKAAEERYEAFVEEQRQEIEIDGATTAVKIAHLAEIVAYAKNAFGEQSKEYQRALAEEISAERTNLNQLKALRAEELQDSSKIQVGGGGIQKDQEALAFAQHQVTKQQELAFDASIDDQQYAEKVKLYDELEKLYADDQKKLESIMTERTLLDQQYYAQKIKLATQAAEDEVKLAQQAQAQWAEVLKPLQTELTGGITGLLRGESPGAAFGKAAGGIGTGLISSGIGAVFQGGKEGPGGVATDLSGALAKQLTGNVGGIAGILGKQFGAVTSGGPEAIFQTATTEFQAAVTQFSAAVGTTAVGAGDGFTDAISALTSNATGTGGGIGDIFDLASGGASGLSDIGDLAAAPAAGGGLVSGGLGLLGGLFGLERGGVISAAGGADIGGEGVLARLHPREMVLPAGVANNVRNATAGGDTHLHAHIGPVNAMDSASFAGQLEKHASTITSVMQRQLRNSDPRTLRGGAR